MAFNTTTDAATRRSYNVGVAIDNELRTVDVVRKRERARKESNFQQAVIDDGLSYEAQLQYRKDQLAEEEKSPYRDNEYISQLKDEIRNVRKLRKFQKVREDYLQNYESLVAGEINLQQHESFLLTQLAQADDEDIRKELRDSLTTVRKDIAESKRSTLNNRVLFAQKDGTIKVLEDTIAKVSQQKAFAQLNGNEEEATMWDVSLASLRKQVDETRISNTLHDISFKTTQQGGMTASQKLDSLNAEIQKASPDTPVVIDGVQYNSAQEFWTQKRDSYLAGTSTDPIFKNFFNEFEGEVQDKIDTVSKVNKLGFVPTTTLDNINRSYQALNQRPEFANFADKLTNSKVAALSYGATKSAAALSKSATETLQLQSGLEEINALEKRYGIDLSAEKFDLQGQIITRGGQLPSIKKSIDNLRSAGAETPPEEVAPGLDPASLAKSDVQPGQKETTTPAPAATPQPTATPGFKEVKIQSGETLSSIAQRELGSASRYKELADFNKLADPNKIIAGATLKIPTAEGGQ